jgi:plasmid stability protein
LLDAWHAGHERIRLDPGARAAKHTRISEAEPRRWIIEQTLVDPEEWNDWSLKLTIDLDRCDAAADVVLVLEDLTPIA